MVPQGERVVVAIARVDPEQIPKIESIERLYPYFETAEHGGGQRLWVLR